MAVDRKFEIVRPTLDRLVRVPLEVANTALLNPNSTSPLALCDGELVQLDSSYKWARASDAAKPSFFVIDDRGDTGVQAARKLTAVMAGGSFLANTVFFNSGLTTVGTAVMYGDVTVESQTRAGLIAHTGSNVIIGYVTKLAAVNNSKLQFICTLT
jgi:hypothetical protein